MVVPNLIAFSSHKMNPISVLLVDENSTFLRIATRFLQEHDDVVVGRISRHPLSKCKLKDIPKSHLYRLYRNHRCCTTVAVQAVQEWCNSGR